MGLPLVDFTLICSLIEQNANVRAGSSGIVAALLGRLSILLSLMHVGVRIAAASPTDGDPVAGLDRRRGATNQPCSHDGLTSAPR
jgi:hypothetical protein